MLLQGMAHGHSHVHSHSLQPGLWVGTPLEALGEEREEEEEEEKGPRSGSFESLVPAVREGHPSPRSFFSLVT